MLRRLLAVVAFTIFGMTVAFAQSCPDTVKNRQALMKRSGDMAKAGVAMVRGQAPYDAAKVKEIFAAFQDKADKLPTLFPDCSKTGNDTHAAPAIWTQQDDFKAKIAKFAADVKTAEGNTKDLDTLKVNFPLVAKDCGGCHETFRTKMD
jgi:cytochrome c556